MSRWREAASSSSASASLANDKTAKATLFGVNIYRTWQRGRYHVDTDIGTLDMDVYLPRLEQFALQVCCLPCKFLAFED